MQTAAGGLGGKEGGAPETPDQLRKRLRKMADTSAARRRIAPPETPVVEPEEAR